MYQGYTHLMLWPCPFMHICMSAVVLGLTNKQIYYGLQNVGYWEILSRDFMKSKGAQGIATFVCPFTLSALCNSNQSLQQLSSELDSRSLKYFVLLSKASLVARWHVTCFHEPFYLYSSTLYGVKHDMSNRWADNFVLCIGSRRCLLSSDLWISPIKPLQSAGGH